MDADNSSSSSILGSSRQRFTIELRPGETTIVSWKKLIKEANNAHPSPPPPLQHPPLSASAQQALKVQFALDEYFQDEKSTTKDNDFIINMGKPEDLNESISSADSQFKKRKEYMPEALRGNVDDHVQKPNKHAKLGHARLKAASNVPLVGQSSSPSQSLAANSENYHDRKLQHPLNSPIGFSRKKLADTSTKPECSLYSGISSMNASAPLVNSKDSEKQRIGTAQCRNLGKYVKDESDFSCGIHLKYEDKNASKQLEPQVKRISTDTSGMESTNVWQREKNGSNGLPDLNIPASSVEPVKTASSLKNVSSLRPKGTFLERAIRELEKAVAESRPPNMEVQDVDNSPIAIKRRLSPEVKQKLAKVARLAQSSQGKISEELVKRLMSILGHLVQLRTLKRNLREMVLLGLSAKREKADRFEQIKREVTEMIKLQEPFVSEENGVAKDKISMDKALEDRICDLYDIYVQMDEDRGPQIRKFYVELAELWPNGAMDNHGIKRAICRSKERRRAPYDQEKVREKARRKKLSMPRMEGGEVSLVARPHERLISESNACILASPNKIISSAASPDHHIAEPVSMCSPVFNLHKPEKLEKKIFPRQLSLRQNKESRKRAVGYPDGLNHQLAAPPRPSM